MADVYDFKYVDLKDGRHFVVDEKLWNEFINFVSTRESIEVSLQTPDGSDLTTSNGDVLIAKIDGIATSKTSGLISASDKAKLDKIDVTEITELIKKVSWINQRLINLETESNYNLQFKAK